MKKTIINILMIVILLSIITISVFAVQYGNEYPDYLNYSGGAYCEVQCSLGRGSLIFPINFQNNTFGFGGSSNNIYNITNSTVNGYFITTGGTEYIIRATRMNYIEYAIQSGYTTTYTDLNVSQIYNTNIEFMDNTNIRNNAILNLSAYEKITISLIILCFSLQSITFLIVRGKK